MYCSQACAGKGNAARALAARLAALPQRAAERDVSPYLEGTVVGQLLRGATKTLDELTAAGLDDAGPFGQREYLLARERCETLRCALALIISQVEDLEPEEADDRVFHTSETAVL
jgi:inactivated superfamily I helicase